MLVNSCDAFEDCWRPFFTLFHRHWPGCEARVYLNTELADWSFAPRPVIATRVQQGQTRRLTWSECLLAALGRIDTPIVLYLQEDYFLEQPVRADAIEAAVELMRADPSIGNVQLSRHGSLGPRGPHPSGWLGVVGRRARYRVSTQAALWRVDTLRSYLRPRENGWMFEILGSIRSWQRDDTFLAVERTAAGSAPFEYLHTGIMKGAWHPGIPALFAANGIEMDFSKRGFYVEKPPLLRRVETVKRLAADPVGVLRGLRA